MNSYSNLLMNHTIHSVLNLKQFDIKDKMSSHLPTKLYNSLLSLLFYVWITYSTTCYATSGMNNRDILCVESERDALIQFKQGILVDNCGVLDSWGDGQDCCLWRGILCSNQSGHVISLRLGGMGKPCLEGTLGKTLPELKYLKYLDLSCNEFTGQLPKFIGSLGNLENLNLSHAGFTGVIPDEMGNLSRLSSLDLNNVNHYGMSVDSLSWLSELTLLREVNLGGIDLSVATNTWFPIVNNLPFLHILRLDRCGLSLKSPSSVSYYINSSSTLSIISLSFNNFDDASIFEWLSLSAINTRILNLDLSYNQMFSSNFQLNNRALKILGTLCTLQTLDLAGTNINHDFFNIVRSLSTSTCPYNALRGLDLSFNPVKGSIPSNINALSSLSELYVVGNQQLNGTISEALGQLSSLEVLDLGSSFLKGVLTSSHLSNLSKLRWLSLSDNTELVVNISDDWVPPFQLDELYLGSCKVGPHFPKWLQTQKKLKNLDISNTGISDDVPVSFFNSLSRQLKCLNMSQNMMYGVLPDVSIIFDVPPVIDLSSNHFKGTIPPYLANVSTLILNNNKLSQGLVPFFCPQNKMSLSYIDLSNNLFSEKLPDCWTYFDKLSTMNLESNRLWGNIPTSIGDLHQLSGLQLDNNNLSGELPASIGALKQLNFLSLDNNYLSGELLASIGKLKQLNVLSLANNNLSGELPASIVNCTSLVILDVGDNSLTGNLAPTFKHLFKHLVFLVLRNNHFFGALPSNICHLYQLQLLDISSNHVHGSIPKCLGELKGMAITNDAMQILELSLKSFQVNDNAQLMWKKKEQSFGTQLNQGSGHRLELGKGIDISNNKLGGQIPEGISSLLGLKSLNLSRNNLSGPITSKIGQLTSIESLDLSYNHLSGEIPSSLDDVEFTDPNILKRGRG